MPPRQTSKKAMKPVGKGKPAPKPAAKTKKAAPTKRGRRTPYELIQDLKAQREAMAKTMAERVAKLDQRIASLEERHAARIQLGQILETKSAAEIEQEHEDLRRQLSLFKKARKMAATK